MFELGSRIKNTFQMSRDFYALFQIQMPARRIDLQDTQNNIVSGELTHLIKIDTENGIFNDVLSQEIVTHQFDKFYKTTSQGSH